MSLDGPCLENLTIACGCRRLVALILRLMAEPVLSAELLCLVDRGAAHYSSDDLEIFDLSFIHLYEDRPPVCPLGWVLRAHAINGAYNSREEAIKGILGSLNFMCSAFARCHADWRASFKAKDPSRNRYSFSGRLF
jgi:hypothetical protein